MGSQAYLLFHFDKLITQVSIRVWGINLNLDSENDPELEKPKSRRLSKEFEAVQIVLEVEGPQWTLIPDSVPIIDAVSPILCPLMISTKPLDLWTTSAECASEYFTAKSQAFSAFTSLIWALTQASEGVNQGPMRLKLTQVSRNSITRSCNYSTRTSMLKSP